MAAEFRRREFILGVKHRRVARQKLQDAVVLRDRPRNQSVEIGNVRRLQISAEPKIDETR
jgi:hypothetical protein